MVDVKMCKIEKKLKEHNIMAGEKKYVSQEKLKEHNKPGDPWISIQGKIYDVTDWDKQQTPSLASTQVLFGNALNNSLLGII